LQLLRNPVEDEVLSHCWFGERSNGHPAHENPRHFTFKVLSRLGRKLRHLLTTVFRWKTALKTCGVRPSVHLTYNDMSAASARYIIIVFQQVQNSEMQ